VAAADVCALVTSAAVAARGRAIVGPLPCYAVTGDGRAEGPCVTDASTAYVMYTSGSSGQPKGVVVSHAACLQFQEWVRRAFGVTERDRFAQTSSLAFGGSVRQVFSALLAGATICPVSHDMARDPDALVRFIHDEGITIWNSVPSLWVHLMDAAERQDACALFARVRCVLIGGEPVPAALVRRWRALGCPARLFNLYGSVETIVNATWFEVVREPGPDDVHTPIGWPRAGTDVTLVDTQDGVGEMAVSGAIADAYFGDPELTRARFGEGAARAYRTGDLGRRLSDGSFVHLGRRDGQVQVRGNRVELVEIEHTLAAHPGVGQAVVIWAEGRLAAAVEIRPGTAPPPAPAELRAFVEARLPAFMVPNRFDVTTALPRTPAGKADRLALRAGPARPRGGRSRPQRSVARGP
jgi:nonribosomal peptide synthetase protein VioF